MVIYVHETILGLLTAPDKEVPVKLSKGSFIYFAAKHFLRYYVDAVVYLCRRLIQLRKRIIKRMIK